MLKDLKNLSLPELEEKVLRFWKDRQIFKKSVEGRREKGKKFVFYEGPPTANGRPGIHHVETRSFKDIVLRYKTMRGFYVPRRAGWDTHGLPVELEVEKELGIKQKSEIEKFGIAQFNSRCKDLIWKYRSEWERITERMGFWIDMENPYITYKNSYMESVWWILAQVHKRGLLKKMMRIVPWCSRCQTPLSSHELGQPGAYKPVKDPSVFVKFKVKKSGLKIPEYFLVWTTTPWTLVANLALAVNPKLTYTKFLVKDLNSGKAEYLWSYGSPPEVENKEIRVAEKISGRKLVGMKYEPIYSKNSPKKMKKPFTVWAADFVSTEEGSGIVHVSPSFGEDDFELVGLREDLPVTIDDRANMAKGFPGEGKYIKEADLDVLADLASRGLLYQAKTEEHEYPHCWRCSKPLIYMARVSWFIEVSKLRKKLAEENQKINWIPQHIKHGRFGEWLKEAKDWSISRNRYWGTPLPIWECQKCLKSVVLEGVSDLAKYAKSKNNFFFLRHAQATSNLENGWVASGPEKGKKISVLTEAGIQQAKAAAKALKKNGVKVVFSSPYVRALDTAKIIAKFCKAKLVVDERLGEIQAGILSGSSVKEYHAYFSSTLDRFFKKPPGKSENLSEVRKRAVDFIKDIDRKYSGKKIAVVSHGDVLWTLHGAFNGLSNEELLRSDFYPKNASVFELPISELPFDSEGLLNLHRPFVDEVELRCPRCKKNMKRVPDILDVWFDSGAMPLAANHFPFAFVPKGRKMSGKNIAEAFSKLDFPADYITEALDQTRGWFYTLLAVSVLLKRPAPYKNVISLGLVLDRTGQKMSKSKGNIVLPDEIMSKYGADAVRWYFYTINNPGDPKRFDEQDLAKIIRRFSLILYNSFVFWNTYAKRPETPRQKYEPEHVLDKWILAKLNLLIQKMSKRMDSFQIGEAAKMLEGFSDDLSRWYIRRSRERFQSAAKGLGADERDWESASFTLQTALLTTAKLLAPFMPFFSEALYQSVGGDKESVHLEDWPASQNELVDKNLLSAMEKAQKISAQALALRALAKIKVRQPLASLSVKDAFLEDWPKVVELIQEEVNVKRVRFDPELKNKEGLLLDVEISQELKEEGVVRELARAVQGLRQAANYKMSDEVVLYLETSDDFSNLIQRHSVWLRKLVNAKSIELRRFEKTDAEIDTKIENWQIWLGVKKS